MWRECEQEEQERQAKLSPSERAAERKEALRLMREFEREEAKKEAF
jgi:hypothetical protein